MNIWGWVVLVSILFLILVAFSETRKLVIWFFGSKGPVAIMIAWTWLILEHVIQAHIVVARNFLPRQMILPSLEKRGVRID
ncbi:MAG: hypothetical protein K8L99_25660 [Anaerolineae bacterium]|jgi:hypothetical protein|nr:hypothetical protein [Anaerolineae bacterium]MCL4722739.1 hypothetical protein [Rhodocyclaceae bacterium]GIK44783.1 MAG: hypothetical protein BroJett012_06860 [Betaproteobacteria bacterium]